MGLNYDTLKAPNDLPAKYGVRVYPTLIIIDRDGIVRKMHIGYSPTLQADLGEILDGLVQR